MTGYLYEADKLRTLPYDPEHVYGEEACPRNHPDMKGIIAGIRWHGTRQQYFYTLRIAGRLKSKRYFEEDLLILKESNYEI
ncbi:MAG: hypothetical protein K2O34_07250 [Acetatifactor sp.]|nr:hypothetical protein [Acetatifactor sp.]